MNKPNCYKCKHKKKLPGNAHIECAHPKIQTPMGQLSFMMQIISGDIPDLVNELNIKGNDHGIKNGWFNWPIDFDPIWLENCDGFEELEEINEIQK